MEIEIKIIIQVVRLMGMIIVSSSVLYLVYTNSNIRNFLCFLILWAIGWSIYDLHFTLK